LIKQFTASRHFVDDTHGFFFEFYRLLWERSWRRELSRRRSRLQSRLQSRL
jgi:hypothetical protein